MKNLKLVSIACLFILGAIFTSCKENHDNGNDNDHKQEHKKTWNKEDHKLVKAAILDYVEGIYEVDSTRIEKSVDSTLRKIGYWYNKKESTYRDNLPMTYNQLVRLSAHWNKDGKSANENTIKKIVIYDVNTKTASAKLTAAWGVDYFHLSKVNNQWKIMNVIWQSIPETKE
ncbi:MAG: nuclear transport factor 2 family protein [Flavobacteriaceae bacterium]